MFTKLSFPKIDRKCALKNLKISFLVPTLVSIIKNIKFLCDEFWNFCTKTSKTRIYEELPLKILVFHVLVQKKKNQKLSDQKFDIAE